MRDPGPQPKGCIGRSFEVARRRTRRVGTSRDLQLRRQNTVSPRPHRTPRTLVELRRVHPNRKESSVTLLTDRAVGTVAAVILALALGAIPAPARAYTVHNEMVSMSDGIRLNTGVSIPDQGPGPWPVLLYRTPYNIENTNVHWIADAGYVGVSQDTRGRFASEGIDRMWRDEGYGPDHRDGLETVAWVLQQPWCSGRIAVWGASASGINGNLLAAALPESIRCMITLVAGADIYDDLCFPGGAFRQIDVESWLRAQGNEVMIDTLYTHPNHDPWWQWLDTTPRHALETIPTYQMGGWFDIFPQGPIKSFTGLQYGGGPGAAGNQKLVMGPWVHGGDGPNQGELVFPDAWAENAYTQIGSLVDWLNYWVFDYPTGIMERPAMAYYMMGDASDPLAPGNEWRTTDTWPPPGVAVALSLRATGDLTIAPPDENEAARVYDYDPLDPVPTLGGGNLVIPAGPYDQRPVLGRDDVLVYRSPVLTSSWEIAGQVSVELYISSDRLDTDFTAKLCDVYRDGRVMLVTDGILRARHRLRMDGEDLLVPGEVVPLTIDLSETAITFNRGHRILLAVSSSNAPRFDPNPNTGEPFMRHTTTLTAHNTVHHDRAHPSRLLLPMTGGLPSGVEAAAIAGTPRLLLVAAPSPFLHRTTLRCAVRGEGASELRIMDVRGRLIRRLTGSAGNGEFTWDGRDGAGHDMPAGSYRAVLGTGEHANAVAIVKLR